MLVCWIYPRNRLLRLPNVERTTLLDRTNLSWLPDDADVVQPSPPPPSPTYRGGPRSSSHPSSHDYDKVQATLRSIPEEQASLRAYVQNKNAALHEFVQEWHDKLCGMIVSQNQYCQDFRACHETW